jgi:hypothetical protein
MLTAESGGSVDAMPALDPNPDMDGSEILQRKLKQ